MGEGTVGGRRPPSGVLATSSEQDAPYAWDWAIGRMGVLSTRIAEERTAARDVRATGASDAALDRLARRLSVLRAALAVGDAASARREWWRAARLVRRTWDAEAPLTHDLLASGTNIFGTR